MYKWCLVPGCTNNNKKTPEKLFVSVPKKLKMRQIWLKLARRDPDGIVNDSTVFLCEDHFDIKKDMANYYQYKMGFSQKILMVDGVVPTKFPFQEERKKRVCIVTTSQPEFSEWQRSELNQECKNIQPCPMTSSFIQPSHIVFDQDDLIKNETCIDIKEEPILDYESHPPASLPLNVKEEPILDYESHPPASLPLNVKEEPILDYDSHPPASLLLNVKEEPILNYESHPPTKVEEEPDLKNERNNSSQIKLSSQLGIKQESISNDDSSPNADTISAVCNLNSESAGFGNYVETVLGKLTDYNSFRIAKQNITAILLAAENGDYKT